MCLWPWNRRLCKLEPWGRLFKCKNHTTLWCFFSLFFFLFGKRKPLSRVSQQKRCEARSSFHLRCLSSLFCSGKINITAPYPRSVWSQSTSRSQPSRHSEIFPAAQYPGFLLWPLFESLLLLLVISFFLKSPSWPLNPNLSPALVCSVSQYTSKPFVDVGVGQKQTLNKTTNESLLVSKYPWQHACVSDCVLLY